jgi:DNA-binding response OmpR family regulator
MSHQILVLDDNSEQLGELIKKLSSAGYKVRVCFSPDHALDELFVEVPHLVIAAGEFEGGVTGAQFAERAYLARSIPSFVILKDAGEKTQLRMRRHPGIIGTYYKPLNVEKLFNRVVKFLSK